MIAARLVNHEPWTEDAACRGRHELFDPRGTRRESEYTEALTICQACPVMAQCAEYAKTIGARGGVWGGEVLVEHPHRQLRQAGKNRKPIAHGTERGYQQHVRRHEKACDACRVANTVASQKRRIRTGA